ncbi:cytochrome b/b6 domain-containing protein [Advenella sp. RU8]|uniref:cytochrome b/b6 domain-containing protein n=1 Tax=Advenella sp. RU8 TaxID=3399575 RepID=UPI003AAFA343
MRQSNQQTINVWDLPTRFFHWALAFCVIAAFFTVKAAGTTEGWMADAGIAWMEWHLWFGYCVLSLILFRIIWGFTGSYYARFSEFIKGPATIIRYVKGAYQSLGHNPLGALSVIALLAVFGFQAFSGLFTTDDIFTEGPLVHLSSAFSKTMGSLHRSNEPVMIILFALHILAIIYYRVFKKQNLVATMVSGKTQVPQQAAQYMQSASDNLQIRVKGLLILAATSGFVYWISTLGASSSASFY